jgi:predicted transcriptional regulator
MKSIQRISTNNKRGWGSITIDVLESTLRPERKTRIMYKSNLNYARFNRYFCDLLEKCFIETVPDSKGKPLYKITEQGKTFLAALKKVQDVAQSNGF